MGRHAKARLCCVATGCAVLHIPPVWWTLYRRYCAALQHVHRLQHVARQRDAKAKPSQVTRRLVQVGRTQRIRTQSHVRAKPNRIQSKTHARRNDSCVHAGTESLGTLLTAEANDHVAIH